MTEIDIADLAKAASVLVRAPVRGKSGAGLLRDGDHFAIIADAKSDAVATVLASAAQALGAVASVYRLDVLTSVSTNHSGDRPHKVLPVALRRAMLIAQASAYVASAPLPERTMREQLLGIIDACGVRHAHLPDITPRAFAMGMQGSYEAVVAAGRTMAERLAGAHVLECESGVGTKLRVELPASPRWIERFGEIIPGKSTTFPAGALFATPADVRGTFVADASVGEFFGAREGLLSGRSVRFTVDRGRVVKVEAENAPELQGNIEAVLRFSANSDRVGLVCIGVNAGVVDPTGEAIVDQNRVGLHLFIGDPVSRASGANWSARTSFAACQASGRVLIDGRLAIDDGKVE